MHLILGKRLSYYLCLKKNKTEKQKPSSFVWTCENICTELPLDRDSGVSNLAKLPP